jgi:L-alanine-DL-glutamate epimerase-like enolase superfamily enzyme
MPASSSLEVPCYDTTLLIDDLHLANDDEAADLIAAEAEEGLARGHRAFKVKVGRGARHMPLLEGTLRDIAVVRAVRKVIGSTSALLLDANRGYNLNLTKRVLSELSDCEVTWIEEPFGDDPVLYEDLKGWLAAMGLGILIASGEESQSEALLDCASSGLIDVVQFDIFGHGLSRWLATGHKLRGTSIRTAPHHYGRAIGNYVGCHLAAALPNFAFVEWDEASIDGVEWPGYTVENGKVQVPDAPGFGQVVDEAVFSRAVATTGFAIRR